MIDFISLMQYFIAVERHNRPSAVRVVNTLWLPFDGAQQNRALKQAR